MFEVMAQQCDQCLMSPNKIVPNVRRREILREVQRKDCHFVCHKATIVGRDVACRGHFDATGGGQLARIAGRLGMIKFIPESDLQKEAKNA